MRQNNGAIEAIYQPLKIQSNGSICAVMPDEVKKTTSKIKFGNETSSRYHKNCFSNKPKPRRARNTVKRNVTTEFCADCSCARKKGGKFKNVCYCAKPPNKPKIPGAPEYTVLAPDEDTRLKHSDDTSFAYRPETLQLAKDVIDYIPQSTFLSRMYRKNCLKCMCHACALNAADTSLKFTERRLNLEKTYHKLVECNRINFDKLSELNCVNVPTINISPKGSQECVSETTDCCQSNSEVSDDDCCARRSRSRNLTSNDEKINAVKSIRKDNYFETHSTENLPNMTDGNVKEHKCVFKFTIGDRGLLEPLNPDAYGTNRCSICNKAQPEESPDYKKLKQTDKTNKKMENGKQPTRMSTASASLKPAKMKSTETGKDVPSKSSKPLKPPKVTQIYYMQQEIANPDILKYKTKSPVKETPSSASVCRQYHGIPLKVCNPSEDKTVQLNIKNPLIFNKNIRKGVLKHMAPANTWALRYQKGCST